jgi:integrase
VPNDQPRIANSDDAEAVVRDLLSQASEDLEPISPERALELYLEDKARDCRQSTVDSHRSRIGFLVRWCEDQGIENLNDLTARDLHEYRVWRREDLNVVSEKTQMDTIRVFIGWCESIDAVQSGLRQKVKSPAIPDGGNARETALFADRARTILDHLGTYEYATVQHVCWLVFVETGMRMGAARALDVEDYRPDADTPHLRIRHRPETDTPIKNGIPGERKVGISRGATTVIDDYLDQRRPDVTDCYGRDTLLATQHGRVADSTIRTYVYDWSRPCVITDECPHDRDVPDCEAAQDIDKAAGCPSSVTPHPIRRGYITHLLQTGVPVQVVSDRCNVSPEIIDQHYDVRSEDEKVQQRQQVLDDATRDGSSYV